jgi:membrane fusion protein (multidrug efflux system)
VTPDPLPPPSPRTSVARRRAPVIAGVVVSLAALFLLGFLPRRAAAKKLAAGAAARVGTAPRLAVVQPKVGSNLRTITLPGDLVALESTPVYARATGYVGRWLVDIGDHVTTGQLLAELDTPDLDQQLQNARETLSQTRASLEQAQANEQYAVVNARRYQTLGQKQAVSQQEIDQTGAEAQVTRANVHAAVSAIAAQTATVRQLEYLKSFARVTAPFPGTITTRGIERGSLVTPGTASGKPLYTIDISDPLRVFVRLPQAYAPAIQVGEPVKVQVRQYPGRDFPGKVTRFSGAVDATSRTLTVEAQVPNGQGLLLPGAYAEVTITTGLAHGVTVIPVSAVVFDAQGTRVATVDGSSQVHFLRVQVGRDLGQSVEVVDGLTGNERVIVTPPAGLQEGERVDTGSSAVPVAAAP